MTNCSCGCGCGSGSGAGTKKVLLWACSGSANVGEIADRAARRLMAEGFGSMSCLAGLGGDDEGMIRAMKDADENVVIDGCSKDCARSVMQRVGAAKFRHLHITDLGIKKVKGVWATEAQVQAVVDAVKADGVM